VRLATTYTQVFYLSRDTTGQSEHATFAAPSRSPDSSGKYSLALGLVNVNLDVAF
jgi:long-chain fatty acid transport protein